MKSNVQAIYKETVERLGEIYEESEANSIANILFEDLLQIPKTKRLTDPNLALTDVLLAQHSDALTQLLQYRPIQQVVGYCFFYGKKFNVNEHTLIPRPETEELVSLIIRENNKEHPKILDIGTGSGCIAVALAGGIPNARIEAWDISKDALNTASENGKRNEVNVDFRQQDVLSPQIASSFDIIVSNPPYIPLKEKKDMSQNVIDHEPAAALFVPDDDPLLFYRTIGQLAKSCLSVHGNLYFEIHENYGAEVKELLESMKFDQVLIHKDLQGKDRMIRASQHRTTH